MRNKKLVIISMLILSTLAVTGSKLYFESQNKAVEEEKKESKKDINNEEICQKEELDCILVGCNSYY